MMGDLDMAYCKMVCSCRSIAEGLKQPGGGGTDDDDEEDGSVGSSTYIKLIKKNGVDSLKKILGDQKKSQSIPCEFICDVMPKLNRKIIFF
jgi:hypothetical protein